MRKEHAEAYATVASILLAEFCLRHHVADPDDVVITWRQHCASEYTQPQADDITITVDDANWSYALSETARRFCDAAFEQERKRYGN